MTFEQRMEQRRQEIRETMQAFSDQALRFQSGIIVGGIAKEELIREMNRRGI